MILKMVLKGLSLQTFYAQVTGFSTSDLGHQYWHFNCQAQSLIKDRGNDEFRFTSTVEGETYKFEVISVEEVSEFPSINQ